MIPYISKKRSELPRRLFRLVRAKLLSLGLVRRAELDHLENESKASADFSVVVAINDAPEVLLRCLKSLEDYAPMAEVILVDDGSVLKQTLQVSQGFQVRNGWKMIRHDRPQGHSKACEDGARLATRPYLCLLNSDTVTTPWSWLGVKRAFEMDPRIGIGGPSTSWASTPQMLRTAYCCRYYWTDNQILRFAQRQAFKREDNSNVELPEVDGFAFFIRRDLWETLGGFDPNLPDYGNEAELCRRASKRGWKIVWIRSSYVHHFGGASYWRNGYEPIRQRSLAAREYINKKHGILS
jgi:hypothetical protein